MESDGLPDELIKDVLSRYRRVVVVGASREPSKPANYVPRFLQRHGYEVVPVNPFADEVLGVKAYKSLEEVPPPVEIVDVFRPSEAVPEVARAALKVKPKVFWMQEGNSLCGGQVNRQVEGSGGFLTTRLSRRKNLRTRPQSNPRV